MLLLLEIVSMDLCDKVNSGINHCVTYYQLFEQTILARLYIIYVKYGV